MSVFPKETVLGIAESMGINLKDDVAQVLLQDTEYRVREIINESIKFMRHSRRRKLISSDINSALLVKNVEPLYGFISGSNSEFKSISNAQQTLYYLVDQEYDLEELVNQPLPPIPHEVSFTAHWLAIEGIQPRIVQNPSLESARPEVAPTQISQVEKDVKVKDILTKELQVYYEHIVATIMNSDAKIRAQAIDAVSSDPGIQGLMPYFVQFITETVTKNLKNLEVTWTMMRFIRALLTNPDIFCEPYLHQLMPCILTCIVTKRLSLPGQDHYALRSYAAKLNAHICHQYGAVYQTLSPRATKTLLKALLDPQKALSCVYGALAGLKELVGPEGVELLVIPNIKALELRMKGATDSESKEEAERLDKLLLETLEHHYQYQMDQVGQKTNPDLYSTYGPRILKKNK